jgi:hypothetical protein
VPPTPKNEAATAEVTAAPALALTWMTLTGIFGLPGSSFSPCG